MQGVKMYTLQQLMSPVRRAVSDFKMIESGAKGTLVDVEDNNAHVTIAVEDHED